MEEVLRRRYRRIGERNFIESVGFVLCLEYKFGFGCLKRGIEVGKALCLEMELYYRRCGLGRDRNIILEFNFKFE